MSQVITLLLLLAVTYDLAFPRPLPAMTQVTVARGDYWCPMHPHIRGEKGGVCRICHMALVLAPPPNYDAYYMALATSPHAPKVGSRTEIRLSLFEPHTNSRVKNFEIVHDRPLHLFILSQDLSYFAHVHPVYRKDGSFVYTEIFPRPGAYRLIADFLPSGGVPQVVQRTIVTAGFNGSLIANAKLAPDMSDKVIEGVRVKVSMPLPIRGKEQLLTFEFFDASTGAPVADLEPYLGAAGHLLLVSANLESVAHSHPVADMTAAVGPTVVFQALFPRAGAYRFWVQVQRHGRVLVAPFTVIARPREQIFER